MEIEGEKVAVVAKKGKKKGQVEESKEDLVVK